MVAELYLIVNADDFGLSHGVNRGIIDAHESGIVTSASLMVRWPAAAEAAAYGRGHPSLSLGLHVDLSEWTCRDDTWVPLYEVVDTDDSAAVADEVSRQLSTFRDLVGHDPSHIDSHQHIHRSEPVRSILIEAARNLAIPLRHHSPGIHYCGQFYGQTGKGDPYPQAISLEGLIEILAALPPGVTELGCHPGYADELDTMYREERREELKVLCDPRLRTAITARRIKLKSFHDYSYNR